MIALVCANHSSRNTSTIINNNNCKYLNVRHGAKSHTFIISLKLPKPLRW